MSNCPNAEVLKKYASGSLLETSAEALSAHLEQCPQCQRQVDEILNRSDSLVAAMRRPVEVELTGSHPHLSRLIATAQRLDRASSAPTTKESPPDDALALNVFVSGLRKCGLLDPSEVALLVESIGPSDSESFARELVARRKLTPFQARALMQGRWKGLILGNYVILDKIGQGGMGHVFKARHRRMGRVVCLKVLSSAGRKSPQLVERFRREAKTVAALNHPNIVVAHDADEADGIHFLVMEFIEGIDLARLVGKYGPLPVDRAMPLVLQVAQALDYAHRKGIVHRDVKPHNLLLTPDPNLSRTKSGNDGTAFTENAVIKILDMGLARFDCYLGQSPDALTAHASMTNTGVIMGTVDYMSPEQALNSRHADCRSDIYSLGCTLCFLLTGKVVFDGETLMEKLVAHRERAVPSLRAVRRDIPVEVDAIFQQMVAKEPGRRYESMSELASDVERFLAGGSPQALQHMRHGAGRGRRRALVWSGMAGAAAVLFALGLWLAPRWRGDSNRNELAASTKTREGAGETPPAVSTETADVDTDSIEIKGSKALPEPPPAAVETSRGIKRDEPGAAPLETPPEPAPGGRDKLLANGGPGRVLLVISHKGFHESDYDHVVKSLEAKGIDFVTTSSRSGQAKSKHGKMFVAVQRPLGDLSAQDFDAVIFCGGDTFEFSHKSPGTQKQVGQLVTECLSLRRAVASIGNGADVLRETAVLKDAAFGDYGDFQIGTPKDQPGSIITVPDGQNADSMVHFMFHELLGGHPDTLANGGRGRAMVVVSPKGFNAAEYTSLCNALMSWEIDVVTASSTAGAATPNDKHAAPVEVDATFEDFDVRDFDAVILCGGNVVEFKSRSMLPKIQQIVDACLSQRRVVASIGNGNLILKEAGYWNCAIRDDRGLEIGIPKNRLGRLVNAPGAKQTDVLIEVSFGDVLRKEMQQPRLTTTPRDTIGTNNKERTDK